MYIGPVYSVPPVQCVMLPPRPPLTPSQLEKELVGTPAEGQVSRSDLIALAGAAAVAVCGGPRIAVPIGRPDATSPDPGMLLP